MTELLDGLAGPEQQAALLAHTAGCAACRAEWQAIQEVDALLTAAPLVSAPAGFTDRVLARLPERFPGATAAQSPCPDRVRSPRVQSVPRPQANPWGGALVLLIGAVLISALIALPILSRTFPTLWMALIQPESLRGGLTVESQLISGIGETMGALWRLHRTLLQSVSPVLLLMYMAICLATTLFWVRLVMGMQRLLQAHR